LISLAPLAAANPEAVELLLDSAFGADRHGRTAYRLREGVDAIPSLSLAAFEGDRLIGTLQSWPIELVQDDGGAEPLILVGPVAVLPDRQRDGIGRMLMAEALRLADAAGETALLLIGDPEYYDRFFGFKAEPTGGWQVPGPVERRRLLARLTGGRRLPIVGTLRARRTANAVLR
jgi:predicted N-acetyltransferase YhbS